MAGRVVARPGRAEPAARRPSSTPPRSRGARGADPRQPRRCPGDRPRPSSASGSTARRCRPRRRARPPARLAPAGRHRPGAYAEAGRGRRRQGVRRGDHRSARTTCRSRVAQGYDDDHRARVAIPDQVPLAPTRGLRAADPRHGRDVTAEMVKEHPDTLPGRRPGRALRAAGAVRRAAAGRRRRGRQRGRLRRAWSASSTGSTPSRGQPLELTLDVQLQTGAETALAGRRPGQRAGRRSRPSDGAILAAANGPGTDGYNVATYGQAAPGSTFKTVSSLALLRAGLTPEHGRAVHADGSSSTASRSRTTTTTRAAPSATSRCAPPSPTPATPPSSPRPARSSDGDLADAAATLGLGIDHDLGFPAYFGSVPAAEVRDRGGGRPDRPGRRARLADGDGDRDGLDPGGQDRGARG